MAMLVEHVRKTHKVETTTKTIATWMKGKMRQT